MIKSIQAKINTSQGLDPLTSRAQRASKTENQRKKEEEKNNCSNRGLSRN